MYLPLRLKQVMNMTEFAAAVVSDGFVTVAYVPRKNSRLCHSFLSREWYY